MNDIERYNFWHSELEDFAKRERLKEVVKKLEGRELFPKKIERARASLNQLESFHHVDIDNRFDF